VKTKLVYYKNILASEMKNIEKTKQTHLQRRDTLIKEFTEQENQLMRWGLLHMLKKFKIQVLIIYTHGIFDGSYVIICFAY
jgi:hypothetical protein